VPTAIGYLLIFAAGTTAGTLLGAVLTIRVRRWMRPRTLDTHPVLRVDGHSDGNLDGEWVQTIPAADGEPEKVDLVHCRQRGRVVEGTGERQAPSEQRHKEWAFTGTEDGDSLYIIYWPTNSDGPRGSVGSIQLQNLGDDRWEGFYVKLVRQADGNEVDQRFTEFSTVWRLS
jgi:hypothetical protein